jgi:RimJ/RimL family protein N-acetyltransferase
VTPVGLEIRPLEACELDAFFAYLDDQLSDNGQGGTALFMPLPRAQSRFPAGKADSFRNGMAIAVGLPGWRRPFVACAADGSYAGHIDLRAHPDPASSHRTTLGMGVHRSMRRRGLGQSMLMQVLDWARAQPGLDWVDLDVLSTNAGAIALYQRCGFQTVGQFADLYRIDGQSVGETMMTLALR